MPYGLHLTVLAEIEHTVDTGAHRDGTGIVLSDAETAERLAFHHLYLVRLPVINRFTGSEKPVLFVADGRVEGEVLQELETWQAYIEVMAHSVLEFVGKARLIELLRLKADLVLERGVVAEGDFLPRLFLTHPVFLFERIKSADT